MQDCCDGGAERERRDSISEEDIDDDIENDKEQGKGLKLGDIEKAVTIMWDDTQDNPDFNLSVIHASNKGTILLLIN